MMRMKSETIAEGSEPSSMGSLASSTNINIDNDHVVECNHVAAISRVSDVVLEDINDDSDEGNLEQVDPTVYETDKSSGRLQ